MNIYDFMDLNKNDRAKAVWQGTFLSDRQEGDYRIQLYSLGSFHVEVFYNQKSNEIERFHPFKSLHKLVPYLEQDERGDVQ
jgi:hypothetical protein